MGVRLRNCFFIPLGIASLHVACADQYTSIIVEQRATARENEVPSDAAPVQALDAGADAAKLTDATDAGNTVDAIVDSGAPVDAGNAIDAMVDSGWSTTCNNGKSCVCSGVSSCNFLCDGRGCTFECTQASSCELQCPLGSCTVKNTTVGNVNLSCAGGDCIAIAQGPGPTTVDCAARGTCVCRKVPNSIGQCTIIR
jgi:hypothetical protein